MANSANRSPVDVELETLIRARYPIIYVVSWEERRVEETLREICQRRGKKMLLWTYTTGMAGNVASRDPLAALEYIMGAPDQSVFVLKDFHPFINDVAVTRRLRDLVSVLKSSTKTLVLLSPLLKLPPELEKEITVVDYHLPTLNDLDRLLEGVLQSVRSNPQIKTDLTPLEREQILKAASGLTSIEAENVFAKSIVEKRELDISVILSEKEQIIRKSGILEYFPASEAFADVGGMDLLKEWMTQRTASFTDEAKRYGLPEPKGILLLGVQGGGKSLCAKAIASLWKIPLLRLDVGKIFSGIVGSSEENMRKAIATAESVAPCVTGDTRVTLADGSEERIDSLYARAEAGTLGTLEVLSLLPSGKIGPSAVRAVTRRPAPDLYTVQLRHGILQTTGNHQHPVLRDGLLTWVRADELSTSDYVAVPRHLPTASEMPSMLGFLPAQTRIYALGALSCARPEVQTPQRRYSARQRGADYVRREELTDAGPLPPFAAIDRFALGRGGTADSVLTRMPERLTEELGYLLGLIASDGYLGKRGTVGFVNTDKTLHERFADLLCCHFNLSAITRANAPVERERGAQLSGLSPNSVFKPCYTTTVNNRLLVRLLTAVQERLLTLPAAFLNAWLRGYFDGDGFISDPETSADPKVILTAKKREGNHIVRAVLQRVGFPTMNPGRFNIEITGLGNVRRFIEQVGSEHPCRHQRMLAWQARETADWQVKDRSDLIPVGAMLRQARQALGMGSNHFAETTSSLIHRYETGEGHPNRECLRSLIAEMQDAGKAQGKDTDTLLAPLCQLVEGDVVWSPVKSVTATAVPEYVYDLACDEPHNFIANGVVTHNCILWIDELEKGFAGTQSSPFSDGGTTSRVFGSFITWLQEKEAACFVVATSNDVSQLPPELMRKGRFDEIFFVDLPAAEERGEIFSIHLKKRHRDPSKFDLQELGKVTAGYSGAEIEQVVVAALFTTFNQGAREVTTEDLVKAAKETVPLSVTMREGIQRLRDWAESRARPTSSVEAETMEELALLEAAARFEASPEGQRLRAEKELAAGPITPILTAPNTSVATPTGTPSPFDMEANSQEEIEQRLREDEARITALERKTATGLDSLLGETQNIDTLPNTPPVVLPKGSAPAEKPTPAPETETPSREVAE